MLALRRRDPVAYARRLGVRVGRNCKLLSTNFGSEPYLITIGERVEICAGVRFLTHDGAVWVLRDRYPDIDVIAPIRVGDGSFVGVNALILPGVSLGKSVVVGAGAVVTSDVEDNTVVAGNPARKVCDVEAYRLRSLSRSLDCKRMGPDEKRNFIIDRLLNEFDKPS